MSSRLLFLLLFCPALVGCPTPTQYGGPIYVDQQGFDARMQVLCGMGRGPGQGCAEPTEASTGAPDAGRPHTETARRSQPTR